MRKRKKRRWAIPIYCARHGVKIIKNPKADLYHCPESGCGYTLTGPTVREKQSMKAKLSGILTRKRREEQNARKRELEIVSAANKRI